MASGRGKKGLGLGLGLGLVCKERGRVGWVNVNE